LRVKLYAVLALALLTPITAHAADLKIAAAANLQQVMTQALIPLFQKQTGATVTPTFGSTKLLATQLQNGAPIDVFVSADTVTTDQLAAQGLVVPSSRRVYAIGRLVMWTTRTAAYHPHRLQDLADPAYVKIAIADPRLAPYGLAAQQSFARLNLTASVMPRLLVARNIGEALQYARSGNVDVSLTALSLVIDDKDDPYVIVPDNLHGPIAQSLAIVKASTEPALAQKFAAFLTGKDAAPIWKQYGYELPRK
jgi:molybdate transport system substrate-binding protein